MTGSELERAQYNSTHDPLTDLLNRRGLEDEFNRLVEIMPGGFSACYLDLDDLKRVNDTDGHTAGDQLIQDTSRILVDSVRMKALEEQDNKRAVPITELDIVTAARVGGDEFVILLVGVKNQQQLDIILQRIRHGLDSVGISASLDGRPHQVGESFDELLDESDKLMAIQKTKRKQEREREKFNRLSRVRKIAAIIGPTLTRWAYTKDNTPRE